MKTAEQPELSLDILAERIRARESRIDEAVGATLELARSTVDLALEQGADLLLAKAKVKHGDWLPWLANNFPKTPRRASDYMLLALKRKLLGEGFFQDAKTIEGAFRVLEMLPEFEQRQLPGVDGPTVAIPPIIQKLNSVAEWLAKEADEIMTWPKDRRSDLKQKLQPVLELCKKL